MYEAHFGLSVRPFGETLAPLGYVAVPSRERVLRRLEYALDQGQGPAIVFGPPGTGKTLLARTLARSRGGVCAHITFPALPAAELLAYLADELGAPPLEEPASMASSVRRLQTRLAGAALRGERPLLIVDEAHLINDPATFEALRLLQNFAAAGSPDLALLFVGAAELLLRIPPGLADRLSARCLLGPLTEGESTTYIQGRLKAVGGAEDLFSPEALALLHRATDGFPRRLNRLADLALLVAYAGGLARPDLSCVEIAARDLAHEPLAA